MGRFLGDFLGETMLLFGHYIHIFLDNPLESVSIENLQKWIEKKCFLKITRATIRVSRYVHSNSFQIAYVGWPERHNLVWYKCYCLKYFSISFRSWFKIISVIFKAIFEKSIEKSLKLECIAIDLWFDKIYFKLFLILSLFIAKKSTDWHKTIHHQDKS